MQITPLIDTPAELTHGGLPAEPVVLSTRIRLARNVSTHAFPGWANEAQREQVLRVCLGALEQVKLLEGSTSLDLDKLTKLEKQVLIERRLISRELAEAKQAGCVVSRDQRYSIMINEEDHLRLQTVRAGFNLETTWKDAMDLDNAIEDKVDYAFSSELGFLTACPTNVGTGLRASAMLHLPGLVMQEHMEKVVRMVNQLGMAVRGLFGEGSEATGSIFQISNQQTLGEPEDAIIKRLDNVLHAIIEQESNARQVILDRKLVKLMDKIGRAYGILKNGHLLSSEEAMNLLSLMRLAVDLGLLPDDYRTQVDRLFIETQPGHIQYTAHAEIEPQERDQVRATRIREHFAGLPALDFNGLSGV